MGGLLFYETVVKSGGGGAASLHFRSVEPFQGRGSIALRRRRTPVSKGVGLNKVCVREFDNIIKHFLHMNLNVPRWP